MAPGEVPQPPSAEAVERLKAAAPRYGITLLATWPIRLTPKEPFPT